MLDQRHLGGIAAKSFFSSGAYAHLRILVLALGIFFVWSSRSGFAQEFLEAEQPLSKATPMQEDASIRDLQIVDRQTAWAVGDRGTVWKTSDGGRNWQFVEIHPSVAQFSLESVQFLTNRVGWIAGGTVSRVGRVQHGVLFATTDGGVTWNVVAGAELPYLRKVQFFDLERGYVSGERTTKFSAGLLSTLDGGATWTTASDRMNETWQDAEFYDFDSGILVGEQGRQSLLSQGGINPGGANIGGLQGFQSISIKGGKNSWIVGDGALALLSADRGATWSPPQSPFSSDLRDFCDFRSVCQMEDHVWIAGAPGSTIWHSPDQGRTWEAQQTGSSIPLNVVHFYDQEFGIAAGALGRLCVTNDGGKSWYNVRGEERRLACWAVHGQLSRVPLSFLTRWGREAGYRVEVLVTSRRDMGVDAYQSEAEELRLQQAVLTAGGTQAQIDWRLPVAIPGLDRDQQKLNEEWGRLTDRRLPEVLLGNLVAQIRMWQPSVILLDEPPVDDYVSQAIHQMLPAAVDQARDPSRFPSQIQLGLNPWSVKKVVMERAPGRRGTIAQPPFEVLPHVGVTLDIATAEASSRIWENHTAEENARGYEVLYVEPGSDLSKASVFSDLSLSPDSATRRANPPLSNLDYDHLLEEAKHRRTVKAIGEAAVRQPGQGGHLLAQFGEMLKPLSDQQAARQLADLANSFKEAGEWAMVEQTYSQLIVNYAAQPEALEAMLWLVQFATSAEMNWQRLRAISASNSHAQVDAAIVQANFRKAIELAGENATQLGFLNEAQHLQQTVASESRMLVPALGNSPAVLNGSAPGANQYQLELKRWHDTAANIVADLSAAYPRLFEDDEMQFVVASLMRRKQQGRKADEIYGKYLQRMNEEDPWHIAARGETFLLRPGAISPKPVVSCKSTKTAPVLDGRLTDDCWLNARELKLQGHQGASLFVGTAQQNPNQPGVNERSPIVMFSKDAEYLYLGASIPKHANLMYEQSQLAGRPRDADLGKHDYLSIQLDIDRDYATYYRFDIDQRGWTREACWDAWSYNPEWFVASEQTRDSWTVEVAIPLKELLPSSLDVSSTWAVGVTRVMPGVGVQSWTDSGGEHPQPPKFGLMRFD